MALLKPVAAPVSQKFGGAFSGEPSGWFVRAGDGRPLKAFSSHFPGSIYAAHFHKGLDIYAALGTPLLAMEAGTVVFAAANASTGYSKTIRVQITGHPGVRYSHNHCDSFLVSVGAVVKRGQPIAKMGKTGNATGVHDHCMIEILETGSDGIKRWMAYDVARFLPPASYRMGAPYGGTVVPGGDLANDDRIYPIRSVSIGVGVNLRASPDKAAPVLLLSSGPMTFPQINEVEGGSYTLAGVTGTAWAKVKAPIGGAIQTAYVAKPLIHPV
jgi:murein DD-endopeptidase MepM/ murein hydrolase activator NlpD